MAGLPIVRMTLYKHGVGFFERRACLDAEEVVLVLRVKEMNDVLKSLTALDLRGGEVLGIEYATPESQVERLAGCSIRLGDGRSLRDLLAGLRGRAVRLFLDQAEERTGVLLGLDEVAERQPLATSLVSLVSDSNQVHAFGLGRVQGVEILDERGAGDLRFFLQTSLAQEDTRQVTIRLTPGEHDLSVRYIAPAPTWRVSYRLVAEADAPDGPRALLQGWGIFDNRLDEDLEHVSLSLVAGMPISFVYDLYTPFAPERPVVEEEARVAAAPVQFHETIAEIPLQAGAGYSLAARSMMKAPMSAPRDALDARTAGLEAVEKAARVSVAGEDLGELFQYAIGTPVSVRRGHSAMVPVVSTVLGYAKDLLYNGSKLPQHPVATLRMKNECGVTLERGPMTVLEGGEYVGEAVLPYTPVGGQVVIPYAVELGVRIHEQQGSSRELRGLSIKGSYLLVEEWEVRWREYQLNSSAGQARTVLVEHPRTAEYELFDSPEPKERTDEHVRFSVQVPDHGESKLRVQERHLVSRREELRQLSPQMLQQYLRRGLLDQAIHDRLAGVLQLWAGVAERERRLAELEQERQKIYKAQQQIQGNMSALSATGKEGALRARYVEQLEESQDQLRALAEGESDLKAGIERLRAEAEAHLRALR